MARVPYPTREDLPPEKRHIYDEMAQNRGGVALSLRSLLGNPEAAAKVAAVGAYIRFESSLKPALRELAILTTAREANGQYEWTHHEPLARKAGLGDAAIAAVRDGKAPAGLTPEEATVVRYARELGRTRGVSDPTFEAARKTFGLPGVIDLTVAVGYYLMLFHVLQAFQVELEPELEPLLPGGV